MLEIVTMIIKKTALLGILTCSLVACSGWFDKDNTPAPSPLVNFTPEVRVKNLWNTRTGSGVGTDYLKLVPAVTHQAVFTADKNGTVTATNRSNGRKLWSIN